VGKSRLEAHKVADFLERTEQAYGHSSKEMLRVTSDARVYEILGSQNSHLGNFHLRHESWPFLAAVKTCRFCAYHRGLYDIFLSKVYRSNPSLRSVGRDDAAALTRVRHTTRYHTCLETEEYSCVQNKDDRIHRII